MESVKVMEGELRERFRTHWGVIGAKTDPDVVFNKLAAAYSAPGRSYHNLGHLYHGFKLMDLVKDIMPFPNETETSYWWHDKDNDPRSKKNEQTSGDDAVLNLDDADISVVYSNRVHKQILSTAHLAPAQAADEVYLCDIDLSIFGQTPAVFDEYEAQIREEYNMYPYAQYCIGRIGVLELFLNRDRIY